ncbi:MAG: chromate efflux transporter [Verrucomicrobiota bacterium]|jgi:chromate transporter
MASISMTDPMLARLWELAWLFLKLGAVSFGGPAAHIAMMEEEVVRRREWLLREEFLDLLGATNLIPGPNSTELAIHIGHRRAGWAGLLVAGLCFILPAALLVTAVGWAYTRFGSLPQAGVLLSGVKPVMVVVVVQALWGLGRSALKTKGLAALGAASVAASFLGVHELAVLFGAGLWAVSLGAWRSQTLPGAGARLLVVAPVVPWGEPALPAVVFGLGKLFLFFLKVGSVLFGSGYVLLAFLRVDLVDRWGWLSEGQLLDAIAVGQLTPGPVFTTATFIGYVLSGLPGAAVATLGIFLPAFVFVAISGPLIPLLRKSRPAGAFLDGVNVASFALMAVVTCQLGRHAVADWGGVALAVASGIGLFRYRVNSAWLVLGGLAVGLLRVQFGGG